MLVLPHLRNSSETYKICFWIVPIAISTQTFGHSESLVNNNTLWASFLENQGIKSTRFWAGAPDVDMITRAHELIGIMRMTLIIMLVMIWASCGVVPSPAGADAYLQPPPLHRPHHQPALPAEQGPLNQGSRHSWKSRRLLQCCEKWVTLNIRSSTMKCIAGVGSNFYTSKAETALRTFTNSFLRIRNLPCSPTGAGKEQNKSVLLYHKEGFKKSSHGKIPLGDTYPRIRFSKKKSAGIS